MQQKEKRIEQHQQLKEYGKWLLSELEKQNITLTVASGNGLHIKGEITYAQKEYIRLWKRQLIELLSPHCSNCDLPMRIIDARNLWFCPLGCESREANK
jgi:hypothetical protein